MSSAPRPVRRSARPRRSSACPLTVVRVAINVQHFLSLDGQQSTDDALLETGSQNDAVVLLIHGGGRAGRGEGGGVGFAGQRQAEQQWQQRSHEQCERASKQPSFVQLAPHSMAVHRVAWADRLGMTEPLGSVRFSTDRNKNKTELSPSKLQLTFDNQLKYIDKTACVAFVPI